MTVMDADDTPVDRSADDGSGDESGNDTRGHAPGARAGDGPSSDTNPPDHKKSRNRLVGVEVVPLAVVVAGIVAGMLVVVAGQWRMGCLVIGAVLGVGAVERALLPPERVGLLQARSRLLDTLTLLVMAVGIIVLAISVHR
jgi:hypothetical protein